MNSIGIWWVLVILALIFKLVQQEGYVYMIR